MYGHYKNFIFTVFVSIVFCVQLDAFTLFNATPYPVRVLSVLECLHATDPDRPWIPCGNLRSGSRLTAEDKQSKLGYCRERLVRPNDLPAGQRLTINLVHGGGNCSSIKFIKAEVLVPSFKIADIKTGRMEVEYKAIPIEYTQPDLKISGFEKNVFIIGSIKTHKYMFKKFIQ